MSKNQYQICSFSITETRFPTVLVLLRRIDWKFFALAAHIHCYFFILIYKIAPVRARNFLGVKFYISLLDLRWARKPRISWNIWSIFFVRDLPPRLWGVRISYWVAYKLIVWYWRKNKNFLEKLFFSMKNIFREKFSRQKNLRFRDFHQNPNDEISDFHWNYFFWEIFFIEKKNSRNFLFFLQYHTISLYATRYEILTPHSLGGSSRIKKNSLFCMICLIFKPT